MVLDKACSSDGYALRLERQIEPQNLVYVFRTESRLLSTTTITLFKRTKSQRGIARGTGAAQPCSGFLAKKMSFCGIALILRSTVITLDGSI